MSQHSEAWEKKLQQDHHRDLRPEPQILLEKEKALRSIPEAFWILMDLTQGEAIQSLLNQPLKAPQALSHVKKKPGITHTRKRGTGNTKNVSKRRRGKNQTPGAESADSEIRSSTSESCDSTSAPKVNVRKQKRKAISGEDTSPDAASDERVLKEHAEQLSHSKETANHLSEKKRERV